MWKLLNQDNSGRGIQVFQSRFPLMMMDNSFKVIACVDKKEKNIEIPSQKVWLFYE